MKTFVVDSGNTSRRVKTLWAIDSGNIARKAKKLWVIGSGNVARLVYAGQSVFTMVAGHQHIGVGDDITGFESGVIGSLSPTTDTEGHTVDTLTTETSVNLLVYQVAISPNPGIGYFQTLAITGGPTETASSATYGYGGGVASWQWTTASFFFTNGNSYTITVVM